MVCLSWSSSPSKQRSAPRRALFAAIHRGDLVGVNNVAEQHPDLVSDARFLWRRLAPLHLAASTGQLQILIALLERGAEVDALDRYGKTPLMLACKQKKWECADWLVDRAGADIIVFGSSRKRSCLHYAAKGGNISCVLKILAAATSSSWDVSRFVNAPDASGITALHLASFSGHAVVVRELLSNGAMVAARTIPSSRINELSGGMSPLHAAARGGSVECVQELLAWSADRRHRDNEGLTAYGIATEFRNFTCAALLDPNAAEPLVWPSALKFVTQLDPGAKRLLEGALRDVQKQRHHRPQHKHAQEHCDSGSSSITDDDDDDDDVCSICFEHLCAIQVKDCGHQMCATCALKLCCHTTLDSSSSSSSSSSPLRPLPCPFCRQDIDQLVLAPSGIRSDHQPQQQQKSVSKSTPSLRRSKRIKPVSTSVSVVRQPSYEEVDPPDLLGIYKGSEVHPVGVESVRDLEDREKKEKELAAAVAFVRART